MLCYVNSGTSSGRYSHRRHAAVVVVAVVVWELGGRWYVASKKVGMKIERNNGRNKKRNHGPAPGSHRTL